LIEGAHSGSGLGYEFLRHIQRTRVLIHLLDGLAENPIVDFAQINSELSLFDPQLGKKPQIVAVNKMDLPEVAERWPNLEKGLKKKGVNALQISAITGLNVKKVLYKAAEALKETPIPENEPLIPVYQPPVDPRQFEIKKVGNGWQIHGASIERAAAMTYWENDESVRRFQRILETLGIDAELRKAGIREGESVEIGEYELEWHE
jgi:GTP-binding protein